MASVILSGDTSGTVTLSAPAVAGSTTQTLVAETGTLAPLVSGTAQATTSGTLKDFTGIPSWVKRITVMFNAVSASGTSNFLVQLGDSGGIEITGYVSSATSINSASATSGSNSTAGFLIMSPGAADAASGHMLLTNVSGNIWVSSHAGRHQTTNTILGGGVKTLSATLDSVRLTTVNGTDTFDAGSINILYE